MFQRLISWLIATLNRLSGFIVRMFVCWLVPPLIKIAKACASLVLDIKLVLQGRIGVAAFVLDIKLV